MMKYEFPDVPLIPMGMVVLPFNITALLIHYKTFQFHDEKYEYFNVIIYIIKNISLWFQMTCSMPSGPKLPYFPTYCMTL